MGVHGSWKPVVSNAVLELRVFIPISLILGGELYNSVNIMVISIKAVWSSDTKHEVLLIKDIVGKESKINIGERSIFCILEKARVLEATSWPKITIPDSVSSIQFQCFPIQYIHSLEGSIQEEMSRHAPLYGAGLEALLMKELETISCIHEDGLIQIHALQQIKGFSPNTVLL
ncbi:hypothetical protein Tco_0765482 [Tanacetum coccineum]